MTVKRLLSSILSHLHALRKVEVSPPHTHNFFPPKLKNRLHQIGTHLVFQAPQKHIHPNWVGACFLLLNGILHFIRGGLYMQATSPNFNILSSAKTSPFTSVWESPWLEETVKTIKSNRSPPPTVDRKCGHIHSKPAASLSNPTHWEDARNARTHSTTQFCLLDSQCSDGATRHRAGRRSSSPAGNPQQMPSRDSYGLALRGRVGTLSPPSSILFSYYYYAVTANPNEPVPHATSSLCNHCLHQRCPEMLGGGG